MSAWQDLQGFLMGLHIKIFENLGLIFKYLFKYLFMFKYLYKGILRRYMIPLYYIVQNDSQYFIYMWQNQIADRRIQNRTLKQLSNYYHKRALNKIFEINIILYTVYMPQ